MLSSERNSYRYVYGEMLALPGVLYFSDHDDETVRLLILLIATVMRVEKRDVVNFLGVYFRFTRRGYFF